ncbi:hypothetical protein Glove_51g83 [Diversispora epigaea]|uniref:Uncharacterized protein n=1 Tax=Diversispora epigaea TaxID=1348612 RepID=A0A397JDP1_9GLOM|nr:hypothetical protein Glove_51g83 [Diversispora epigaea]
MSFSQPILTLIHNSRCNKSKNAHSILCEALKRQPGIFKLDILEYQKQPPTKDQLRLIAQYLNVENDLNQLLRNNDNSNNNGKTSTPTTSTTTETSSANEDTTVRSNATNDIRGINHLADIIKQNPSNLQRPIVVDWNNGKAIIARPPEKLNEFLKELGYWKD